jgi:DNA-binding transcriptional ArsR family regulator
MRNQAAKFAKPALLFAALGDKARLGVVAQLCQQPAVSISVLTAGTNMTRQGVTKHLDVLRRAGLVRGNRVGREVLWQLERRSLDSARAYIDAISKDWDAKLSRLTLLVENQD